VPDCTTALVSTAQLIEAGAVVHFEHDNSYMDLSNLGGARLSIGQDSMIDAEVEMVKPGASDAHARAAAEAAAPAVAAAAAAVAASAAAAAIAKPYVEAAAAAAAAATSAAAIAAGDAAASRGCRLARKTGSFSGTRQGN
jgi:hypothetical protein